MNTFRLYKLTEGAVVESQQKFYRLSAPIWDELLNRDDIHQYLSREVERLTPLENFSPLTSGDLQSPVVSQEVWAAGVTYYRSRSARMEEAKDSGGGSFYDRVYHAERPELFFKATPHRVAGHNSHVRIRRDSKWNVPEPELALVVTSNGRLIGYTIGNDVSSRDIEGENPLYLPQAKVYDRSCALGPAVLVTEQTLPPETEIRMEIVRGGETVFAGATTLSEMKRTPQSLIEYLFFDNSFPAGCFLLTGTGCVPSDSFTLHANDQVRITIEPIGTLINTVE
ncbi:MAG: fumarylacetoacetate hydrolase family protein [Acidobacteriota bacterium]|nr:fumarylacetoacetate hydrolase family protein [Acidobacteriota bacterium]